MGYKFKLVLVLKYRLYCIVGREIESQWRKAAHAPAALATHPYLDRMFEVVSAQNEGQLPIIIFFFKQ